ncbi:MAG TPA: SHOCT domain-containing protein [Geothermobacteraceae bacterium]|nr:SHOCT domain-containing protein [Geothermobacteraceae bacterium]
MAAEKQRSGLFSSLFLMYLVLLMHGLAIVLFALLVVFFRGVVTYLPWIMLGGALLIILSAWIFWRKFRNNQREFKEMLNNPLLRDRAVELRFLGGVATVRLGAPGPSSVPLPEVIEYQQTVVPIPQLEDAEAARLNNLARLIKLRDKGELTESEFQELKQRLLNAETQDESREPYIQH